MRSGFLHLTHSVGNFVNAGMGAEDWSSRASSTDANGNNVLSAYYLYIPSNVVKPSQGPYAYYLGRPLRCLSTVLDI